MAKAKRIISRKLEKMLLDPAVAGLWVALTYDTLIATGATSTEVYEKAQKLGYQMPILWFVPKGGFSYYTFIDGRTHGISV